MIRHARLSDGGSSGSSPSSSGTSTTTHFRVARTIPTILTRRDMLRVAMDPIMDLDIVLITAIIELMGQCIGVGLEAYLFRVVYRNSSAEGQYPSKSGVSRRSTIVPSLAFPRGSM